MVSTIWGRYLVVGAVTAGVYLAAIVFATEILGVNAVVAGAIGFLVGVPANFWLHRNWSFRSERKHIESIPRFAFVVVTNLLVNSLVLDYFVRRLGVHYLVTQLIAMPTLIAWNFIMLRLWVFGRSTSA